jgi:hypothetical protein
MIPPHISMEEWELLYSPKEEPPALEVVDDD